MQNPNPLAKNAFLVKEHIGLLKAANDYDVYDPETGAIVLHCREEALGPLTRLLRFSSYKRMTPFDVRIRTPDGRLIVQVRRGVSFLRSRVEVVDGTGVIGRFRQKVFSLGGAFDVLDAAENVICTLKGKWTGWDFRFIVGERELAHVSKKWAGSGQELFTSADNYVLSISEAVGADDPARKLILAAVMCIDMVLKE
jgi:uncharacterized protein YxjI